MQSNKIYDIMINLLNGIKNHGILEEENCNGEKTTLTGCKYLLNQVIRQYRLPDDHYFVSKKAQELWSKISTQSIFNYTYQDTVVKNIHGDICIDKYRGGEGEAYASTSISYGDKFTFKDVFTDEHIVTVSNIIGELLALPTYDYHSIENVLSKLYICKMLKGEDRAIQNKRNRSTDYRTVIATDYKECGIEIADFDHPAEIQQTSTAPIQVKKSSSPATAPPTGTSSALDLIRAWCRQKEQEGALTFLHNCSIKKYTRFTTADLDEIIPYQEGFNSGWKNGHFYTYEIENYKGQFRMFVTFSNNNNTPPKIQGVFKRIMEVTGQTPPKENWQWWSSLISTKSFTYNCDTAPDDIFIALNSQFEQVTRSVALLVEKLKKG
jgi:hypothetical protein